MCHILLSKKIDIYAENILFLVECSIKISLKFRFILLNYQWIYNIGKISNDDSYFVIPRMKLFKIFVIKLPSFLLFLNYLCKATMPN